VADPVSSTPVSYESARDELVEVVRRLEQGGTSLEESLTLWERGEQLARTCEQLLDGAQARVDAALGERPQPG
jgi:exodeoxyribonuclease VII small subunit